MPANASPMPTRDAQIHTDLATVIADLTTTVARLTSLVSQTDQLEGYSDTIEPKLQSLIDALAGTLSVGGTLALDAPTLAALEQSAETSSVIGWTYFSTSDARYGFSQTYTEWRASDGKTRTVTLTRDTSTGALTGSNANTATWA